MAMPELADLPTGWLERQAVQAWRQLRPEGVEPERIEILKGRKAKPGGSVCRLAGMGPAGSGVIAKRCRHGQALVEHAIYQEVLPQLPVPTLRCYGFVAEADGRFGWLFLEDAGGQRYSASIAAHRRLAAQWLGLVHTASARIAPAARLRERGPGHYREQVRSAHQTILGSLVNPALAAGDLAPLKAILAQCELLESRWDQVERFCEGMPRTFVHGDFVEKNLAVRTSEAGTVLLPFDWGNAGWGVPAIDLAQSPLPSDRFSADPDLATYVGVVRDHWPGFDLQTIQQWANLATLFRCLTAIDWSARGLAHPWVEEPLMKMRFYQAAMAHAMRALGWAG